MDFRAHLKKQLGFLERSCSSYDEGFMDEAIRIATIIRVLVHNTKSSTSLLKHLKATTINLTSSTIEPPPGAHLFIGLGMMSMNQQNGSKYEPALDTFPSNHYQVPVSKWWSQVVMIPKPRIKITRKSLVLSAANKDGGAHVDKKLNKEYEELSKEGAAGYFGYGDSSPLEPTKDVHLVSLRQLGWELLNSPELLELID